ncbi:MAG: NAD-dependent epimerase/dehydratase family protein [Burkholderiaceae bacterium]|jgi:UDP-glucuronate 4-epimerase|nr:NAD-dependent epimerase/dehydratase family protein [Burkholderiaceae bacterium]
MTAPVLLTGAAGFIGMHVARRLLERDEAVVGVDNLNAYYDPALKRARLEQLRVHEQFTFHEADVADRGAIDALFDRHRPQRVVHLAAQAGVRYALTNPMAYSDSNLTGTTVILEACRRLEVRHLVFASSSSVYGANRELPFSEGDAVDHPVSFYAATKRANELMAHSYAHLFALPVTALRYFTVYGPWGRPDMAIWKFADALLRDKPIDVYAGGVLSRDFTYVDDAVEATLRLLDAPRAAISSTDPDDWNAIVPDTSWAPFEVVNLGRSDPVSVNELLALLERITGRRAQRNELGMQPGDVERTYSDTTKLARMTGYTPNTPLEKGLRAFVDWFRQYHRID